MSLYRYGAVAGVEAFFTVQARDQWGNARTDNGVDDGAAYTDGRCELATPSEPIHPCPPSINLVLCRVVGWNMSGGLIRGWTLVGVTRST